MKSSFCIDLQRFMLIPTKFPLSPIKYSTFRRCGSVDYYKHKYDYTIAG